MVYAMQWAVVPALAAVARNVKSAGCIINAAQLSIWTETDELAFPVGAAELALRALRFHGWCSVNTARRYVKGAQNEWLITPAGLHAAQAALRSLPGTPGPDVSELSTRLWNLLRIRRHLTAEEAAETLVDADSNFAAQKKRIGALLAAWARLAPKAVAVAVKREAGHIRYVLQADLGRWPPPSKPGQMHPMDFSGVQPVPARYLKRAAPASSNEGLQP